MVTLIDPACAARGQAQRLWGDSRELEAALRAGARATEAKRTRAEGALAAARDGRAIECASPWSSLIWLRDDETLHDALVPID